MKIKLAILESDKSYLRRMVNGFSIRYPENFELYSFTDLDSALKTLVSARIDVFLAGDMFDVDVECLPKRCAFAYLVDSNGIDVLNDQQAIWKFQKVEMIYKQILSVYSEKASRVMGMSVDNSNCKVLAFGSASGGVGSSTVAAACALHFAEQNQKVLYLNLEKFGGADVYFSGQGQYDMSDVIYALCRGKGILHMKLESCVRRDSRGVYFYAPAKNVLDMCELALEQTVRLITELKTNGGYDYIIIDADFNIDKETLELYKQAQVTVLVGDGSEASNNKTERAYHALEILESQEEFPLTERMVFMYNGVRSQTGMMLNIPNMRVLGGTHVLAGGTTQQVVEKLSHQGMFDNIFA